MAETGRGREYYTDAVFLGSSTKGDITVPTSRAKALLFLNSATSGACLVLLKDKDGNTITSDAVGSLIPNSAGIIALSTSVVGTVVRGGLGGVLEVYELY
jgi:hypothetical protein